MYGRYNFSEVWIGILSFSFKKVHSKRSSAKWRPFCLGLNVLILHGMMEVACMCHVFSEQVAQTTTAPGVVFSLISLIAKIQTWVGQIRFHRCYEKINQSDWTPLTHVSWLRDIMDLFHMHPANERRRYIVTSSLIGRVHTQNDTWVMRGGRLYSCYEKKNYWTCGFCHGRLKNGKRYSLNSGYVPLVMLCFMFFHKQLSIHPSHPSASPSIHIHPSIHPSKHLFIYTSMHPYTSIHPSCLQHWKPRVVMMMSTLSSLVTPEVVITTTSAATSDDS